MPHHHVIIAPDAWKACGRAIEGLANACTFQGIAEPVPPAPALTGAANAPNWDAMANSFAALSAAVSWGATILGFVALIAGLAWGRYIAMRAENEARTEARKAAHALIDEWLAKEAPGIIRTHMDNIGNTTLGADDDDKAADDMGKGAG